MGLRLVDTLNLCGERVLIFGGSGFIGSYLAYVCHHVKAEYVSIAGHYDDIPKYDLARFVEKKIAVKKYVGDIADTKWVGKVLTETKPTIIFHLASKALVIECEEDPIEAIRSNVLGTTMLLENLEKIHFAGRLIVSTSDKVYRDAKGAPRVETSEMWRDDIYGISKVAQDMLANAFRKRFGRNALKIVIGRAGNVIGPGDKCPYRLFSDIWRSYRSGEVMPIRYPTATRPWQHVVNCCLTLISLGKKYESGDFNIGHAETVSNVTVSDILRLAKSLDSNIDFHERSTGIQECHELSIDSTKLWDQDGYIQIFDSDEAIRTTLDWCINDDLHQSFQLIDQKLESIM